MEPFVWSGRAPAAFSGHKVATTAATAAAPATSPTGLAERQG